MNKRIERDSMGEMPVPEAALYGAQTARAIENFPISQQRFPRSFLRALGRIKVAAARVNHRLAGLSEAKAAGIEARALEVAEGQHDDQFVLDIFQTGSGTSTNMNANEVIAHLANVHPNDDVNRSQSSNDVIPAALHLAALDAITERLLPAMQTLALSLDDKAAEFHEVLKIGRTHLQDAVPMRLGQEFSGYARQVELSGERIVAAMKGLYELPIGGTAIGTGLNTPAGFAEEMIKELSAITGQALLLAKNPFEAQAARDAVVFVSGALRNYAVSLTKIANDLRWLGSGPRCGLGEIVIPAVQPGSSIMPGKVNPVIAESVLMVCAQVVGHDAAIAWCGASGNFEINVTMPLLAANLLDSIELLAAASTNFESRMVRGIEANKTRATDLVEQSLAMVTALVPAIGYDRAAAIAKHAASTGETVRAVAMREAGLDAETLRRLLDPTTQTDPHSKGTTP
ncbi:class II fumarate hydratase [Bryobacter aggregatus]|uniref:class II fumarate hydratase n=1 Tax=Bryobacter aggregatus TaxID=360054 RepID=UPI0004E0FD8B|nr:class II fumarate hydratase [Bryobacter aggregatus]